MKTKEINKNKTEVKIEIKGKEWDEALNKSFKKNAKDAKVDGFRKGKVPRDQYEKQFGIESLFGDAIDSIMPSAYEKVLAESNLTPACQPAVNIDAIDKEKAELVFTIVTIPELKLGKYKKLGIKKPKVEVTKEEIDEEIDSILKRYAELKIKDGKIENGNVAVIDFEGSKDGIAFEGGKSENYPLEIGSNSFIPGFEEKLLGLKKGDEKDIELKFPDEYQSEDLRGKNVVFKVKVNEVKEKAVPKLNEEFFKDYNMEDIKSEKDLRHDAKERLKAKKEQTEENAYIDSLLAKAASNSKVDIPEEIVNDEIGRMIGEFSQQLKMQGIEFEQYMQMTGTKEEDLRKQMNPEASKRVHYRLLLDSIATEEKVEISNEEAKKQSKELAEKYGMKEEEFLQAFGGTEMIKYDAKVRRAMEILKEQN